MLGKDENVDLYYSQTDADENGHYTIKLKNGDVVLYTHRIQSGHGLSIRTSDKEFKWSWQHITI